MVPLQRANLLEETPKPRIRQTAIALGAGVLLLGAAVATYIVQPRGFGSGHIISRVFQFFEDPILECPIGQAHKLVFLDGPLCVPVPRKTMRLASEWWYQNGTAVYIQPDGTVVTAGSNVDSEQSPLAPGTKVVEVDAGGGSFIYLTQDRQVFAVGHNGLGTMENRGQGALGVGDITSLRIAPPQAVVGLPPESHVFSIAAGFQHYLFLLEDGRVFGVGNNDFNQLGLPIAGVASPVLVFSKCSAIAASGSASFCLQSDGSVLMTGGLLYYNEAFSGGAPVLQYMLPTEVSRGLEKVHAIAATSNADSVLFIHVDGSVSGMGVNRGGELGLGDLKPRTVPTLIPCSSLTNVVAATLGTTWVLADFWTYHGFAIFMDKDGTVFGSGYNANNQLGSLSNSSVPTIIPELRGKRIVYFAAGSGDATFLEEGGSLLVAGANTDGELLVSGQNVAPISGVKSVKVKVP